MSKKWHENIPENGVLCKQSNGSYKVITEIEHDYHFDDCTTYGVSEYGEDEIEDLTPLTAKEIWQFMPWQDMDSYPRDASRCFVRYKNSGWIDLKVPTEVDIRDDIEWLPLPQAKL